MIVHGAIAPPRSALEELLGKVLPIVAAPPAEAERRGFLRRRPTTAVAAPPASVVDAHPLDSVHLSVAGFGNLTSGDVLNLSRALTAAAADWTPARVFFSGVTVTPGEPQVWATLDGDIDGLTAIGRGVGMSVERLGFFVDRRKFQPAIEIGTVSASADDSDVSRLVEASGAFRGQEWLVDSVALLTQTFDGPRSEWRPFELVPVGRG